MGGGKHLSDLSSSPHDFPERVPCDDIVFNLSGPKLRRSPSHPVPTPVKRFHGRPKDRNLRPAFEQPHHSQLRTLSEEAPCALEWLKCCPMGRHVRFPWTRVALPL